MRIRKLCGCYYHIYSPNYGESITRHYLPQVDLKAHTTILSETAKTTLKQNFHNPTKDAIKECIYTFPLYDGVSVVSFECHIGTKTLHGLVKEKQSARVTYQKAVGRGETAGLLEQSAEAADVFTTKLGNVPAGESVLVEICYVGELKHDAEANGIRFTLPTAISPRYGSFASSAVVGGENTRPSGGITITVDATMTKGTFIRGIQSPTHPIAVTMGGLSVASAGTSSQPQPHQASATLSLGTTELEKDFVLVVLGDDTGTPKAILEQHPSIPNQRALMATLVPKFSLPPSQPEIIFVVDRSGSMSGNIPTLVSAMKVFLKSLPGGVKFNVLSFGSRHSFLWPKSKSYAQESLQQALAYVQGFRADLGGTETFNAMRSAVESRFGDLPLDIMLLTDGQIWNQQQLFDYLNQQVTSKNAGLRVFTLGIGDGISHSLVEGIARAGNGFAQTCTRNEKIETKVIRMLKGCLSPHISDYTLEVKYDTEENGLEMVDKVADGLKVLMMDSESIDRSDQQQKPISLFDLNANPDDDHKVVPGADIDRFEGVPDVQAPKLLQAPHTIPPLFPFTRTSIYLLMSPDTVQATPKSVILRASCLHGPLELEIPVEVLSEPQETIHQLAAKKAIQDLEEGRGWLFDARDQKEGGLLKERFPSRFQDMVEREAVRLGVQFQVGGKWCSFVAVAANEEEFAARKRKAVAKIASRRQKTRLSAGQDMDPDIGDFVETGPTPSTSLLAETKAYSTDSDEEDMGFGVMDMPAGELIRSQMRELSAANSVLAQAPSDGHRSGKFHARYLNISVSSSAPSGGRGGRFDTPSASRGTSSGATYPAATSYYASTRNSGGPLGASSGGRGGSLFGASPVSCGVPHSVPSYDAPSGGNNGALFGSASGVQSRGGGSPPRKQLASMAPRKRMAPSSFKRMSAGYSRSVSAATPAEQSYSSPQPLGGGMQMRASMDEPQPSYAHSQPPAPKPMTDREKVLAIIDLQGFEGSWSAADANADVMKMTALGDLIAKSKSSKPFGECKDVFSTAVVVSWLEQRMRAEKDVWELVVDKAKAWIEGEVSGLELEELMKEVRELVARA